MIKTGSAYKEAVQKLKREQEFIKRQKQMLFETNGLNPEEIG
ncbi:hypothetical protein [Bacillus sp. M6-12]|nr:hypothetical protein [Bacillus sp. M6-12]